MPATLFEDAPVCTRRLRTNQVLQLAEVRRTRIGDEAKLHVVRLPLKPVVTLVRARAGKRLLLPAMRPHEKIDQVLAARINDCGNAMSVYNVESSANQRETLLHEIRD